MRRLFASVALCVLYASIASAENPRGVVFVASADHNAVNNDGPVVARYDLEIYTSTGTTPVQVLNLGKPAPSPTNEITFLELRPVLDMLTPGPYVLKVAAFGPSGASRTPASDPVTVSAPSPCRTLVGSPVEVLVLGFDLSVARSNPTGALIRFEASSDKPVNAITLDLEGDGEPAVAVTFPVGVGFDGRFVRALAFKPSINGTWPLVVTATDTLGRTGSMRCSPGITVGF